MDEPSATAEESKKISAISKESVHRICSGQVVVDLAIAVKELVENSLDSGATSVEVKLIDYGKTCITVIDNGSGVLEKDFEGLGLKHHTSKLKDFSDLLQVETFGFRGEALSSLCSLSNLNIITRHSTSQYAFDLQFNKDGILIQKQECARNQGTTVNVSNIFKNLPVRSKEFEKNIKKEYTKMIQILYSYCLVSTGVKITCTNTVGNKPGSVVVSTNGSTNVLDNITAVFGRKGKENLIEIELQSPSEEILQEYNLPNDISINFSWHCFVSSCSHTLGRSSPDRQFFYVNGRPCDPAKISRLINHIYHKYNNKQYPFVYLDIKLKQSCADVNVTPDKRTILFTQEQILLATIKSNFERTWSNMQGSFTVKTLEELNFKSYKRNISDSPENSPPSKKQTIRISNNSEKQKPVSIMEDIKAKLSKSDKLSKLSNSSLSKAETSAVNKDILIKDVFKTINEKSLNYLENEKNETCKVKIDANHCEKMNVSNEKYQESELTGKNQMHSNNENNKAYKIEIYHHGQEDQYEEINAGNEEDQETFENESVIVKRKLPNPDWHTNLQIVKNSFYERIEKSKNKKEGGIKYRAKLDAKSSDIEKELQRELTKESFEKVDMVVIKQNMQIIGQFNLGFILTSLDSDIFIVDQHASDEKYRFEKLSNETKLKTQKLILPKKLNFSVLNETILMENQRIFEDNGFTFRIKDEGDPGNRVELTGMPVSYGWQFDLEDIEELIFIIREGGADGTSTIIPRPTRVRQMLASRACRSAVMIGKALNFTDMQRLLTQMSQMKNPWNCPHGRPTLRHLLSLNLLYQ
ncbi:hypothetical protein TSAR_016825 [Trichomalopsis sarcophagae]|uniref:MutL C-terminal dimerisation domain-containing protein n=1 Tax=Trichomalopsis sarcophagae TaxID=543379 RepID=A0A232FE92_9HYME|nr:hypothetical protein TSAR_016825 [Trichomalopsis sarcophagae]